MLESLASNISTEALTMAQVVSEQLLFIYQTCMSMPEAAGCQGFELPPSLDLLSVRER